jgi:26S proteasome regulatory subunit N10
MFLCVFFLVILYAALQMSVQDAEMSGQSDMSKVFEDRSFVTSILNSVSHLLENQSHVIMNLASVVYNAPPVPHFSASWC